MRDTVNLLGNRGPSQRARRAESLARRVLDEPAVAAPLRGLVEEAARITGAEHGQLSIISTRQIAVITERSARGCSGTRTVAPGATANLEDTLGAVVVRANAVVVIPDARHDSRVASTPAVERGAVGSYLGVPLHDDQKRVVGVLCVYTAGRHDWAPADPAALAAVAARVAAALAAVTPGAGA